MEKKNERIMLILRSTDQTQSGIFRIQQEAGGSAVHLSTRGITPPKQGSYVLAVYSEGRAQVLGEINPDKRGLSETDFRIDGMNPSGNIGAVVAQIEGNAKIIMSAYKGQSDLWLTPVYDALEQYAKSGATRSEPVLSANKDIKAEQARSLRDEKVKKPPQAEPHGAVQAAATPQSAAASKAIGDSMSLIDEKARPIQAMPIQAVSTEPMSYYEANKAELEAILLGGKPEEGLANFIPGSRWVRVPYEGGGYFVFGIIYDEERLPLYICYGVPGDRNGPPENTAGFCQWLPAACVGSEGEGYWMMYQDALTGRTVEG